MLVEPVSGYAAHSSAENTVTRRITVITRRMRIMATFDTDPAEIGRILASAGLPLPEAAGRGAANSGVADEWAGPGNLEAWRVASVPLPSVVTNYQGRGFDTCAAPSVATMAAWRRRSVYRAVGIYIGGSDAACAQPNLTPGWLREQAAAGWHFIPMYVGPQAAFGELGKSAAGQGAAAAADAAKQARLLGFGPLTPIYYDMEAYLPSESQRALRFESAWTATLHALGYSSGVYSSSASGVADLAHQYGRGRYAMPDVIYDARWNGQATTHDAVFGPGEWVYHQRLHQYSGDVSQAYGGVRMLIDQDYLDVVLPIAGATPTASQAVAQLDGTLEVFYRGTGNGLWYVRKPPGKDWARPVDLGGSLGSPPSAVALPTGRTIVFYRGVAGRLWQVSSQAAGWSRPAVLKSMGVLGSRPWALSEPNGVIDVFWVGPSHRFLWHGEYTPGKGWRGPQRLGSGLASDPSPVISSPGVIHVFWKGQDGNLWQVTRDQSGPWSYPAMVDTGPLGSGGPYATAQPDGRAQVFWRHHAKLLGAFLAPDGRWSGPYPFGDEVLASPPTPVSADTLVHVLFVESDGGLWQSARPVVLRWRGQSLLLPGPLGSAPFAASEPDQARIDVFWKGSGHQLWWTSISPDGRASAPSDIGGHVR